MNRPDQIPEDLWPLLTVAIAARVGLLPPGFADGHMASTSCTDIPEKAPTAVLLRLRCADSKGAYSEKLGALDDAIEKARVAVGLPSATATKLMAEAKRKDAERLAAAAAEAAARDAFCDGVFGGAPVRPTALGFSVQHDRWTTADGSSWPPPVFDDEGEDDEQEPQVQLLHRIAPSPNARVLEAILLCEDIHPNSKPVLDPFVTDIPMGRGALATVRMQPVTQSFGRPSLKVVVSGFVDVEFTMYTGDPGTLYADGHTGEIRARMAREVLLFDLAVRRGEPTAVGTYGLIQMMLAWRKDLERQRKRAEAEKVRALVDDTDGVFAGVFATARAIAQDSGH